MDNYFYRAFGLVIESEFPIAQIPQAETRIPDVRIVRADLSGLSPEEKVFLNPNAVYAKVKNVGAFRVTDGKLVQVDPDPDCSDSQLGVYLMGSSMGAILHQRGYMPIHGSCVTDGKRAVLITGDSGAGKSTTAAEFLKRGWKLITDDVSAILDVDGVPVVQSSYPSQKLWQDALERYDRPESDVHSLYFSQTREKFGVDVQRFFHEGRVPLRLIVRLIPADCECNIGKVTVMAGIDQLMKNTYRRTMIEPQNLQRHFQRCVTLSTKVPMAVVLRQKDVQCADTVYNLITDYLGGIVHD